MNIPFAGSHAVLLSSSQLNLVLQPARANNVSGICTSLIAYGIVRRSESTPGRRDRSPRQYDPFSSVGLS